MLEKVKALLNLKDNTRDELLSFYIDLIRDEVLNYCNLEDVPKKLENLIIKILLDFYTKNIASNDKNVKSIKRGDTEITYQDENKNAILIQDFLMNYRTQLNCFRRLRTP